MNDEPAHDLDVPVAQPRSSADLSTRPGEKLTRAVPGSGVPSDAIYAIACAVCVLLLQVGIGMYRYGRYVADNEATGSNAMFLGILSAFAMLLALGGIVVAIVSWVKRPDAPRWAIAGIALNVFAFFGEHVTWVTLIKLNG